jgi:hypothetical protein
MFAAAASAGPDSQEEIVFNPINSGQVLSGATAAGIDVDDAEAINAVTAANDIMAIFGATPDNVSAAAPAAGPAATAAATATSQVNMQPFRVSAQQVENVINIFKRGVKISLLLIALDAIITAATGNTKIELLVKTIKAILMLYTNTLYVTRKIANSGIDQIDFAIQFTADAIKAGFFALAWGIGEAISICTSPMVTETGLAAATGASVFKSIERCNNKQIYTDIMNVINRGALVMHEVATASGPEHSITAVEAFGKISQPTTYHSIDNIMTNNEIKVITIDEYASYGFRPVDARYRSVVFRTENNMPITKDLLHRMDEPLKFNVEKLDEYKIDYEDEQFRQLHALMNANPHTDLAKKVQTVLMNTPHIDDAQTNSYPDNFVIDDNAVKRKIDERAERDKIQRTSYSSSYSGGLGGRRTKGRKSYKKRTHKRRPRKTHKKMLKRKRRRTRK